MSFDDFLNALHLEVLDLGDRQTVVEAAVQLLTDGHDSPSLRILAGLTAEETDSQFGSYQKYLQQTAAELGFDLPSRRASLLAGLEICLSRIANTSSLGEEWSRIRLEIYPEFDQGKHAPSEYLGSSLGIERLLGIGYEIQDIHESAMTNRREQDLIELRKELRDEARRLLAERPWISLLGMPGEAAN